MSALFKTASVFILIFLGTSGCKETFIADALFEETNFLVVEGYVNVGEGPTTLKLSRTIEPNSREKIKGEAGAVVNIVDQEGQIYSLTEHSEGIYTATLNLSAENQYSVNIVTTDEKMYVSEFVGALITPEIDSIFYTVSERAMEISLATHDNQGSTNFYQWEFDETWEIHSPIPAGLKYEDDELKYISSGAADSLYRCYKYGAERNLQLYSTANLTSDKVSDFFIFRIMKNDERLGVKYSVLARQHALTREAYDYFTLMKRTTGPLGSFSDPQPSELVGNIKCVSSDEPVVGFIVAATTTAKLKFIFPRDVPDWKYDFYCEVYATYNHPDSLKKYLASGSNYPAYPLKYTSTGGILTFIRASNICIDCRRRGGINTKPEYWD